MTFIAYHGNAGLHPFNSFPYHYYEGGVIGRDVTMEWCKRLIDVADEFWLFGISDGALSEFRDFIQRFGSGEHKKEYKVFVREFDYEWQRYLDYYREQFADIIPLLNLS